MPQKWFPVILEPHEEQLGFGIFVGTFDTPLGFEYPEACQAVICPIGESDAVFKMLRSHDGMVVYRQRCFGSRSHPLDPAWYDVDDFEWLDAGSALKKVVAGHSSQYVKVRRQKYAFTRALDKN